MRDVRVICDNHNERLAVATYYISSDAIGARSTSSIAPADGRYVDLCDECATVLGWMPPPGAYKDDEPVTDEQRRLIFARCGELGLDDEARHVILESVTGDPSIRNLLAKDVDRVLAALKEHAQKVAAPDA